jgi:hypothetical protein
MGVRHPVRFWALIAAVAAVAVIAVVQAHAVVQPPPVARLDRLYGLANRRYERRRGLAIAPDEAVRERFYGTSEELRPLTLPRGYGDPTSPRTTRR